MERNRLIIIEGPQGTGKSTLTNFLRDNIPSANLYRLSGQKDKTETGKINSITMYNALIEYLEKMQQVPMDMIFDRTFFSEVVYARLKFKNYSFDKENIKLTKKLNSLNYDIHYLGLYLENVELFRHRLARESHHNYQAFSLESSVNQQNEYMKIADELEAYSNINVHRIAMDDFDKSYSKVKTMFNIK